MTTLLEKRQQKTINDLLKRRKNAQDFIAQHTAKLEEKLAPYKSEIQVVEQLLTAQGYDLSKEAAPESAAGEQADAQQ